MYFCIHQRHTLASKGNWQLYNKILLNGSWHSFSMLCNCQPIRFFQHFMWPSTNQISTACHVAIDQSDSYSMSWPSTNHIPKACHVTFDQSSAASLLPTTPTYRTCSCTVSNESCHETKNENETKRSHLLSNCTTVTMPAGIRGRLRMLSHMNHEAPTASTTLPCWVFVNKSSNGMPINLNQMWQVFY